MAARTATRRRTYDWPQVALVAVVGGLAIAAMAVLGVTWDGIAAIPASEWLLIASALTGVATTSIAAVRRAMVETAPSPTTAPHTSARTRETEPPEAP